MNTPLYSEPLVAGVKPLPPDVATHLQAAPLPLAPVGTKSVALACDGGRFASEAGIVLLKDSAEPLGRTRALAAVLAAPRDAPRLHWTPADWLTQRVFHMAAGSEEANDAHRLRDAPRCTLMRARRPAPGAPWASPPPIARFANRLSRTARYRMARGLLEPCSASYARPPPRHRARRR